MMFLSLPAFLVLILIPKPDPTLPDAPRPEIDFLE
jgi:hypothetical protein